MSICKLTIVTSVDGAETKTQKMGKLEKNAPQIQLSYREENAAVAIRFEGNTALVEREGDYSLRLPLKRGERTFGSLTVGGSEGKMEIQTHGVEYCERENLFQAELRYSLCFGEEEQQMRLRIEAQTKG